MSMKWSAKHNCFFYPNDIKYYRDAGWDMTDVIDVDKAIFDEFKNSPPGKNRDVGLDGMPCWTDAPPPPPLSHDEEVALAESQKLFLLQSASQKIGFWQTQLQLGMISDADKAKLIEWMHYITALQAVDTSTAPDIQWPPEPQP